MQVGVRLRTRQLRQGHGQPTGRVHAPGDDAGDRGSTLLARDEGQDDGTLVKRRTRRTGGR
jgi:hypothetical protein